MTNSTTVTTIMVVAVDIMVVLLSVRGPDRSRFVMFLPRSLPSQFQEAIHTLKAALPAQLRRVTTSAVCSQTCWTEASQTIPLSEKFGSLRSTNIVSGRSDYPHPQNRPEDTKISSVGNLQGSLQEALVNAIAPRIA